MKIIVDMNLSPSWVEVLHGAGWDAFHWSTIGHPTATDVVILAHAREAGAVVFTHDLDFGRLLALTHASGPSVVQVRTPDVTPKSIGPVVLAALRQATVALEAGALVTIDASTQRIRILPLVE